MNIRLRNAILVVSIWTIAAGCAPLHQSLHRSIHDDARNGDVALVEEDLTERPGDVNLLDDAGLTPLHLALTYCHTNVAALLLAKGAEIDAVATGGTTPLHIAAQEGCVGGVQLLLSHQAKINVEDSQGRTPLKRAELWHQETTAEFLREHGGKD